MTAEHNQHSPKEIDTTTTQNPCQQEKARPIATTETWTRTKEGEIRVKRQITPDITTVSKIK